MRSRPPHALFTSSAFRISLQSTPSSFAVTVRCRYPLRHERTRLPFGRHDVVQLKLAKAPQALAHPRTAWHAKRHDLVTGEQWSLVARTAPEPFEATAGKPPATKPRGYEDLGSLRTKRLSDLAWLAPVRTVEPTREG